MKILILFLISLTIANSFEFLTDNVNFIAEKHERNYLWNEFHSKQGPESLNELIPKWRESVKKEIKELIHQIPQEVKNKLLQQADSANKEVWESFKVSDYIKFVRNGDRHIFESELGRRRSKLSDLVIGELITDNGKYMDQIANGLWLTLEESTWVFPAHLYIQDEGLGLPDPKV